MKKEARVLVLTAAIMILLLVLASKTLPTVLIFIPAVIIALIFSVKIVDSGLPNPDLIISLYLLALAIQFLHFAEEYVTDFCSVIPALFDRQDFPINDWVIFNMVAYSLFVIGGIILFRKVKMLVVLPLFFIIAGVFMNTVGHILLSIWQMKYMPGLITVFLYIPLMPRFVKALKPLENKPKK